MRFECGQGGGCMRHLGGCMRLNEEDACVSSADKAEHKMAQRQQARQGQVMARSRQWQQHHIFSPRGEV